MPNCTPQEVIKEFDKPSTIFVSFYEGENANIKQALIMNKNALGFTNRIKELINGV